MAVFSPDVAAGIPAKLAGRAGPGFIFWRTELCAIYQTTLSDFWMSIGQMPDDAKICLMQSLTQFLNSVLRAFLSQRGLTKT